MDIDEATYLQERSRQLVQRAGLRRRDVLRLGAALPVAAGIARVAGPTPARAAEAAVSSPILKPLPPEWFVSYGTNAEMRWDSVCLLYTSPSPRDLSTSRMPSSA